MLARLEERGALGVFQDRPEDSITLARKFQALAEGHNGEGSLAGDVRRALRAIRQHWGIENSVHWVLDAAFDEDDCRIRKDHAPINMATLRQRALNLLRQETTSKKGIAVKRSKAGWDNAYLRKVIDEASQF